MPAKQTTRWMARASPVFAGQARSHSDRASFVISYKTAAPQEVRDYLWSGLVSLWAARQRQGFQPPLPPAKGSQTLKNRANLTKNSHN